jgi:hypothetical protein
MEGGVHQAPLLEWESVQARAQARASHEVADEDVLSVAIVVAGLVPATSATSATSMRVSCDEPLNSVRSCVSRLARYVKQTLLLCIGFGCGILLMLGTVALYVGLAMDDGGTGGNGTSE